MRLHKVKLRNSAVYLYAEKIKVNMHLMIPYFYVYLECIFIISNAVHHKNRKNVRLCVQLCILF